jgi:hypothetical protein
MNGGQRNSNHEKSKQQPIIDGCMRHGWGKSNFPAPELGMPRAQCGMNYSLILHTERDFQPQSHPQ